MTHENSRNSSIIMPRRSNMKNFILIASSIVSLSAKASHFGAFDKNQIAFANKLLLCPKEVSTIMSRSSTKIVEANFAGGLAPEGVVTDYKIKFIHALPAPSFHETTIILNIRETIKRLDIHAPDALSTTTEVKCEIE